MKTITTPYGKIYGYKESGRLFVKDNTGKNTESRPVKFGAYISHERPLCLWDYSNIRGLHPSEAIKELMEAKAVFVGMNFEICFYEEEDFENLREFF